MPDVSLEKFSGPLDLLLQLIEQEELNITEISISTVTEQYFEYLKKLDSASPEEELADFLVIATKLVYLKSKNLLPYLYPDQDEGPSLADQLKMYKRYAEASRHVEALWTAHTLAYGRVEPPVKAEGFVLPNNATTDGLHNAMLLLLKRLKPLNPLPQVSIDRSVSVRQKIEAISDWLTKLKKFTFRDLLGKSESKTDVIVSFLALLELVKQEKVSIHQDQAFENLEIRKL